MVASSPIWEARSLREVVTKLVDGSHNPPPKQDTGLPMLSARNIDRGQVLFDDYRLISESAFASENARTRIAPGDVLLTIVGTIGRTAVVPEGSQPFSLQRSVAVLTPSANLLPKFLCYQLESPAIQKHFEANARGTAQKGVYLKTLGQTPVVLPPVDLQREIVAELEKQFSRLDEAVANLQRVKANLKRYKASVLNDAVEGRLVESDSPAALVKLGSVANLIDPQPSHRTPPTHPDGVPYIGIGDVLENGKLDFQNSRKVSPTVLEEHRARYTLRIGDFIFGKIGTLGRPTLLMPPFTYTLSANVVLVQADGVRLLPEYALIFMDSPKLLNMISREAKATTQAAYGIKRMRDLEINLPPVEQQRKIVAEVDRHLSIIREVEAEVDANLQRARALRQSTLSSVFSGG